MELRFTKPNLARYSKRPLPEYRHLPFQNPHPFLDSDGHSHGETLSPPAVFGPDHWKDCPDYLYCIDLFNHGYWWEAHERLKQLSLAAGRESPAGLFIQGLIQIAAALLKHSLREEQAAAMLAEMGVANLQTDDKIYYGVDVPLLIAEVRACLAQGEGVYPRIQLADV